MRRYILAILSLAASTAAAQVAAPSRPYVLSLGFGGGATIPTGNGGNTVKSGVNGQGYALVQLPGLFARFASSSATRSLIPRLYSACRRRRRRRARS